MYSLPSFVSHYTNDNLKVKDKPMGYYLYPRSSISKTAFRMSNSVGIIDSGYRGNLCAYFDVNTNTSTSMYTVESMQRLVQICSPTLEPFYVFLVDHLDSTERGGNGFGSSGI